MFRRYSKNLQPGIYFYLHFLLKVRQKSRSFALERLVERDCLNTVVLNLYAGNKGYSLAFRQDNSASTVNDRHVSYS